MTIQPAIVDRLLPTLTQPALVVFHQASRLALHTQFPQIAAINIGADAKDFACLGEEANSYSTVIVDDALARINDYRSALADWFRVIKPDGTLILVVPQQFYFEEKLMPPSHKEPAHRRFYTSATLLSEVEEALEPFSYQVVEHEEALGDRNQASILLFLKKCEPPEWASNVMRWDSPEMTAKRQFSQISREQAPGMIERLIKVLPQQQKPQRFLLLKLDHRGDFLLAKKAFELFRGAFPSAHITLCCGAWNVSAAEQQGLFDDVVAFDYFKENPSLGETRAPDESAETAFEERLAALHFDVAIDFRIQGDTRHLLERVKSDLKIGVGRAHQFPFLDFNLDLNSPVYRGQAISQHVPASEFSVTALGRHDGYRVVLGHGPRGIRTRLRNALGRSLPHQMLIFGPYEDLRPGRYLIRPIIEAPSRLPTLGYDISVNRGQSTLQAGTLTQKHINEGIELDLEEAVTGYELRIYGPPDAVLQFYGAHVFKQGESGGTHSEEQMAMLALFCALRLEFPYQNAT
ncbi:hypothetical protein GH984_10085 [Spiribacter sp. C176]|uniref:Methyltransferase domain-containing protein n=1 Tax=Spiribacter salilacus TaxID=2664894 RepID=A0A6N7QTZ9_9GAMM|nr:hypothetical protein [Spiribacter salilacus]MRH79050.1 hypothetical protein [Spiribacter salilacus]